MDKDDKDWVSICLKFQNAPYLWGGKTCEGIDNILEAIVSSLPAPKGKKEDKLKSLLVDSWYDSYLGVVILVRVIDGKIKKI